MPNDRLTDFLTELEDIGELKRIDRPVDLDGELAEVTRRVVATGGPALFFEQVRDHTVPVATNVFGTESRVCRALKCSRPSDLTDRLAEFLRPEIPNGWLGALKMVPQLAKLSDLQPQHVKTGTCQQVVEVGRDVDLRHLPMPSSYVDESAAGITLGQVVTADTDQQTRNVGLYPLHRIDANTLAIHWTPQSGGFRHWEAWKRRETAMPIAVVLGAHPALTVAASMPMPPGIDESLLASLLIGHPVDVVACRTIELTVPAASEFVIEGFVDFEPEAIAPPHLADEDGRARQDEWVTRMRVTAVTRQSNPAMIAGVMGGRTCDTAEIRAIAERLFLPVLQFMAPEIVDLSRPRSGACRHTAFLSFEKRYANQASKLASLIRGLSFLATTKLLVLVDADVDVHDEQSVWSAVSRNVFPERDVRVTSGLGDYEDTAAPVPGKGSILDIDATRKLPDEGHARGWPPTFDATNEVRSAVTDRWSDYGLGLH